MRLLDTDVMVDVLRGRKPAIDWLESLQEVPGLPGLVVMELLDGCQNREEMGRVRKYLQAFQVYWADDDDSNRAMAVFTQARLTHHSGILDVLIAECAIGLGASLCTFNTRHFQAVPELTIERPYDRTIAGPAP